MQKSYHGRVAKWLGSFGFIRCEGKDVFVHLRNYCSGFHPELNQLVEFELGPPVREDKSAQALRVRVIKTAAQVEAEYLAGLEALQNQGAGAQ